LPESLPVTDRPQFTIAIPTYNNELTVANAIHSAISQDYPFEYELLIVNNASTDGTLARIEKFLPHPYIRVITNAETCTLYENHNVCLREARGDYVVFCHSDDVLDTAALSIIERRLAQRGFPRRVVMWGHSLYMDFSDELRNAGFRTGELFAGIVATRAFFECGLTASGTCYCKSFIDHGGFFPVTLKAAPSDASSMVMAALKGFRFEMMDDFVFFRTAPSTALPDRPLKAVMADHENAFSFLLAEIDNDAAAKLLFQNRKRQRPSLLFYYSICALFPKAALQGVLKHVIRHPWDLRRQFTRTILYGVLRKILLRTPT
jgi:glycosyltransferase involved in cell wall biosynthesis